MTVRTLAIALAVAGALCGQRRFSWQNYCFNNPGAPFCRGHEYAVKRPKPAKGPVREEVAGDVLPLTPPAVTQTVVVVGGIDWRFADPFADAIVGINFNALTASPLGRSLFLQLGAAQGLAEADAQKLFDGLSGVGHVALSVRDNQAVAMITGRVPDAKLPAPEAGWKAVPVPGNAMLIGHTAAVDEAMQRLAVKGSRR